MAIKITGSRTQKTGAVQGPWSNSAAASFHCLLMIDPAATPSDFADEIIAGHDSGFSFLLQFAGAGTTSGTFKLQPNVVDSTGTNHGIIVDNLLRGVVYDIAVTHASGAQKFWLNALPTTISSFAGNTQDNSTAKPWNLGGIKTFTPGPGAIWTIDDAMCWIGYTLTQADAEALRDGTDPLTIGTAAAARYRWTCAVPAGKSVGDAVEVGDSAIRESLGTTVLDITSIAGTGSGVYAAPLVWIPAADVREARISTGGKSVFFFPEIIATGADAIPTTINTVPTVTVNGVNKGSLTNQVCSGIHKYVHFTMPAGIVIGPGDGVTFDAPVLWASTSAGAMAAMTARPAVNRVGRSSMSTELLTKTLKMGLNLDQFPSSSSALVHYRKNWATRLGNFSGVVTADANGKPLTLSATSAYATLYSVTSANGIDATRYPGPTGLFAIGWDDLNPSVPTNFSVGLPGASTTTTVTERADLRNFGSGGIGQVRVYNVQRKAGSAVATTDFGVYMSNANKAPQFEDLVIYSEGDFTYTDNTPVVLDNSDPYAPSSWFLDRVKGAGSLRCWFNLIANQASSMTEVEHVNELDDFSWGWTIPTTYYASHYVRADPYSTTATPYYYTHTMGSKFPATLAADIDAATTALTVSDAATAPVIIGLRLYIGSEIMRVTAVSGTTVTVIRGAEDTTPATHAAGAIQVGYRCPTLPIGSGVLNNASVISFTTTAPHRLQTGMSISFDGTWPTFTTTDPAITVWPPASGSPVWVTGPNSFFLKLGTNKGYQSPCVTLGVTQAIPTAATSYVSIGGSPEVPYAYAAILADRVGVAHQFLSVPHAATNDLIRKIFRDIRDNSTPGKITWWTEVSCEVWNFVIPNYHFSMLSASLYPGQYALTSYVVRTGQVAAIAREIFDEGGRDRSGELKFYINVQTVNTFGAPLLTFAAAQTPPIKLDGLAHAPYVDGAWMGAATQAKFASLDADQCADLFIHALVHRSDGYTVQDFCAAWQVLLDAYNAATGFDCRQVAYEGGIQYITSSRAKDRDIIYSPTWYFAEQDMYALFQRSGFTLFNLFALAHDWNQGLYLWGLYHHHLQGHGRGDGSDGKADNRLCMAQTKAAAVNQDLMNVSVRGQAWLDWNRPAAEARRRPRFLPHSSRARY